MSNVNLERAAVRAIAEAEQDGVQLETGDDPAFEQLCRLIPEIVEPVIVVCDAYLSPEGMLDSARMMRQVAVRALRAAVVLEQEAMRTATGAPVN